MSLLEVNDLSLSFGKFHVLHDVTMAVEEGEIFGIAGPNGAGKTTLFNTITGYYHGSGEIAYQGESIGRWAPHKICHHGITRTWQVPELFGSLSVEDNVQVGAYFGRRRRDKQGKTEKADIAEALEIVSLSARAKASASALDLYEKKMVMIAAALATKPKVIMLDEPVGGLSPKEVGDSIALFQRLNQEFGLTVIIIEHVMRVLTEIAGRLLILSSGESIMCDSPAAVCAHPDIIELYLGHAEAEAVCEWEEAPDA